MTKGDIVLVPFPFTNLSGSKNRPALVPISGSLDVTVALITSQQPSDVSQDIRLNPSDLNGLKTESFVRLSKMPP